MIKLIEKVFGKNYIRRRMDPVIQTRMAEGLCEVVFPDDEIECPQVDYPCCLYPHRDECRTDIPEEIPF